MKTQYLQFERSPAKDYLVAQYNQDTRNQAVDSLVDALLASCTNQAERTRLAVALLGYDPSVDSHKKTISDFIL